MHCNYLKYGDIVDFCYITKSFCSIKVKFFFSFFFWGGGVRCRLILGLLFRIWAVMKSNGHYVTRNGLYDP